MKTLKTTPQYCTGCRLCVLGCAFHHTQAFSEALARMRIRADEARWDFAPVVCQQCPDAPCVDACPTGAIIRDPATGALHLDENVCAGCRACEDACRHHAIVFNEDTGLVQLCDLCGGSPACVASCPHGAIEYSE